MASDKKGDYGNQEKKSQKERRNFLKKVAYSAPSLIALGQLVKPTSAHAESNLPPPPW